MTWFQIWIFKRILRQQVRQGPHKENITELYRYIREAAEKEFYEDNLVTLNSSLTEYFENSLRKLTK